MRLLAIIASLAQLSVVLLLYYNLRVQPGGWVVSALFGLLVVALINLIVLLFYTANKALHQPLFGPPKDAYKRQDLRIKYVAPPYPTLIVNARPYHVLDLSERGLRFSALPDDPLPKRIRGRVTLLSGRSLSFNGNLIRRQGDQAAVGFTRPIEKEILLGENCVVQSAK
jgi:hypothetical protein